MSKFKKEPAVIIGAAVGVVGAGLTLAASLGASVTPDQTAGICAGLLTVAGVVQGLITRQFVWSPASHELDVDLAQAHAADSHGEFSEETSEDGEEPTELAVEDDDTDYQPKHAAADGDEPDIWPDTEAADVSSFLTSDELVALKKLAAQAAVVAKTPTIKQASWPSVPAGSDRFA